MNLLPGSPVSLEDVKNVELLFGTDFGSLKGKTTRKAPEPVISNYIDMPRELINLHKDVTIAADMVYINKVTFLSNAICPINLNTTSANEHVPDIKQQNWGIKKRVRGVKCTLPFKKYQL
eukprot:13234833-Ditylum_brightwellii.AAC.1